MTNIQDPILTKKLHSNAKDKINEYTDNFVISLLMQAKIFAFQRKADVVLSSHIDEAFNTVVSRRKESWLRQISKIFGGAMFGAFIPGFISALSQGTTFLIIIFTVMGFIGLFLVFLGIKA